MCPLEPTAAAAHGHNGGMSIVSGTLHHVELQTRDLTTAVRSWGWLLTALGYELHQSWSGGRSWALGATYIVVAAAPRAGAHDRRSAGLSHLAFHAGAPAAVDGLWSKAPERGWSRLYTDRHPWAGGEDHYAAYLENEEQFKVELVATAT